MDAGTPHGSPDASVATDDPRAIVRQLHDAEVRLSRRRIEVLANLAGIEQDASRAALTAALDGSSAVAAVDQLQAAQAELVAISHAIDAAREQRRAAILAAYRREALPLRAEADDLRAQADEHQLRTDDLLAELRRHEGVDYVPTYRPAPLDLVGLVDPEAVDPRLPATAQFRAQADALDARAGILETRRVPDGGQVEAGTIDELLGAIAALDPMIIAPRLDDVAEWATAAIRPVAERLARLQPQHDGYGSTIRVQVVWTAGGIDPRSRAYLEPPPAPIERHLAESRPGY
jgi:hypothetical protein